MEGILVGRYYILFISIFLLFSDLYICFEIDGNFWNRVIMLLDLKINDLNISILFRIIKVKYLKNDKIIR